MSVSAHWKRQAQRIGYRDGLAGVPMRRPWTTTRHRLVSYPYGMGYFHGRAHRKGGGA